MKHEEATVPPAPMGQVDQGVRPTHWMDERGLVLTNKQRNDWGGDWQEAYTVPCRSYFGRVTPLHKCGYCDGKGRDPKATYDACPVCGKSGGLPGPNASMSRRG